MASEDDQKMPQNGSESLRERGSNLAEYGRARLQSIAVDLTARVK